MKTKNIPELFEISRVSGVPAFLWSVPGVSKTSQIEKICEALDIKLFTLVGSTVDPTDVVGHYVADFKGDVLEMKQSVPRIYKILRDGGVLFLDEFNNTSEEIMAVFLRILDSGRIGEYQLKTITIIGAGNPPEMAPNAVPLPASIKSRFFHVFVEPSFSDLYDYVKKKEDGEKESFVPFQKPTEEEFLKTFKVAAEWAATNSMEVESTEKEEKTECGILNFRTLEYASRILAVCEKNKVSENLSIEFLYGCIGNSASSLFNFFRDRKLPSLEEVLSNPESFFDLPEQKKIATVENFVLTLNPEWLTRFYKLLRDNKEKEPHLYKTFVSKVESDSAEKLPPSILFEIAAETF
ncbi:MAG: ATPase AAA [Phycisphaerae bacterium]|nr:MAG: ATPase AAA [Phycisphaerae bacterium]